MLNNAVYSGETPHSSQQQPDYVFCLKLVGPVDECHATTLQYLAERWAILPPHICEAIVTLVDAAGHISSDNSSHGGTL